jgi:tripartite-type tricarboxylate transporter receptor subunit TctC
LNAGRHDVKAGRTSRNGSRRTADALKERLARLGADPMTMMPAAFDAFVKKEIDLNAELVKAAGVKVN